MDSLDALLDRSFTPMIYPYCVKCEKRLEFRKAFTWVATCDCRQWIMNEQQYHILNVLTGAEKTIYLNHHALRIAFEDTPVVSIRKWCQEHIGDPMRTDAKKVLKRLQVRVLQEEL